jgi:hypothetical protein
LRKKKKVHSFNPHKPEKSLIRERRCVLSSQVRQPNGEFGCILR